MAAYLPAVALLGPRQLGKTTLAHRIAAGRDSVCLDLESPRDREKLSDPQFYLSGHEDQLVVLDEVQRIPDLFATLRGLIDSGRRRGKPSGRFLLLGSASADRLRQSETRAGRIAYIELSPLDVLEVPRQKQTDLWVRGGFPESFVAPDVARSLVWRDVFIIAAIRPSRGSGGHWPLAAGEVNATNGCNVATADVQIGLLAGSGQDPPLRSALHCGHRLMHVGHERSIKHSAWAAKVGPDPARRRLPRSDRRSLLRGLSRASQC